MDYARLSKIQKNKIETLIKNYFKKRKQLINAFLLIDIRHQPQNFDLEFMLWLNKNLISFSIIFTKSDKLKINLIEKNIIEYKNTMFRIIGNLFLPFLYHLLKKTQGKKKF